MTTINPAYIQIGNEINDGFVHPKVDIYNNLSQFLDLMKTGITAERYQDSSAKIIIHYAGIDGLPDFLSKTKSLDCDIISFSYYPILYSTDMSKVASSIQSVSETYSKNIIIAETFYAITLCYIDCITSPKQQKLSCNMLMGIGVGRF